MGNSDEKRCPYCGEMIKSQAVKCRFCGEFLEGQSSPTGSQAGRTAAQSFPARQAGSEQEDEQVIYNGPLSRVALVGPVVTLLIWIALAVVVAIVGPHALKQAGADGGYVPFLVALGIGALATLWFAAKWIVFRSRVYRITKNRIQYERGVFSKRIDNMDMWRVQDIRFHRSFLQGLLGLGSIFIVSSDGSDPEFKIGPVRDARHLFEVLQRVQREADRRQGVVHIDR